MTLLVRCARRATPRTAALRAALDATGDDNAFNPSYLRHEGEDHVVYRAHGPGRSLPFVAVHLRRGADGRWVRTDLTAVAAEHGVPVVADPKLVALHGALWVTFNTGHQPDGNALLLMRLTPSPGVPQPCLLEERQRVEKNWGFHITPDGRLGALYAVDPLVRLELAHGEPGDGRPLAFRRVGGPAGRIAAPGLSLGTQPWADGGRLLLVGHQKVWWRGRRGYLGRPVTVDLDEGRVRAHRTVLVHSAASVLRGRSAHNPHASFVTYFAGLAVDGDRAVLGYGVDDARPGFAEVEVGALWR